MYITNKEIISILNDYYSDNSKKNERKLFNVIRMMCDKCKYRREFIGHVWLHPDMVSNAYFFFFHNLKKGNIKIKNIDIGQISTTIRSCEQLPSQEIIIKERIDNKFFVRKIKKISDPGKKVKQFEYLDDILYEINYEDIKFNDCFAYITSIITTAFWKIINMEKLQHRTAQMIFNFEIKNNDYVTTNDIINKEDFSTDYEKEKVYEMMKEAMEYEKAGGKRKRKSKGEIKND